MCKDLNKLVSRHYTFIVLSNQGIVTGKDFFMSHFNDVSNKQNLSDTYLKTWDIFLHTHAAQNKLYICFDNGSYCFNHHAARAKTSAASVYSFTFHFFSSSSSLHQNMLKFYKSTIKYY